MNTRQIIIDKLKISPISSNELCLFLKLTKSTVNFHLKKLKNENLIFINHWEKSKKQTMPVYFYGRNNDAKKPNPLDRIEIMHRYIKRIQCKKFNVKKYVSPTPWDSLM